ncbi:hypothetical protein [Hungatella hathewayi]|uniref:hypothetical protein n=1 Tax=Hungatella hathewayi TaxID=154046 RepID=UPI0035693C79
MFDFCELEKAYGNHFQDLFSQLMKEKHGMAYQPTCTYGNIGDMSVDGVFNSTIAFAVYAPEIYNDNKTLAKMREDINGFLEQRSNGNWQNITKYVFVIKKERAGITAPVLNLIGEFTNIFPVEIISLDDLRLLANSFLPFSSEGNLFLNFRNQVTPLLQYIIEIDFSASHFRASLPIEIDEICKQWDMVQNRFKNSNAEFLRRSILDLLNKLSSYLTPLNFYAIPNFEGEFLMFNHQSDDARKRLEDLRTQTYQIRCKLNTLLEDLYKAELS